MAVKKPVAHHYRGKELPTARLDVRSVKEFLSSATPSLLHLLPKFKQAHIDSVAALEYLHRHQSHEGLCRLLTTRPIFPPRYTPGPEDLPKPDNVIANFLEAEMVYSHLEVCFGEDI